MTNGRHPDPAFMAMAIAKAKEGIVSGQTPFGACLVRGHEVVACEHNEVWRTTDITAHAEINVIRSACRKLGVIHLENCVLYSTCEPCPMCFSAIHWARISCVVYGAAIADAQAAGFNELAISNEELKTAGKSLFDIVGHFLRDENVALFRAWKEGADKKVY